jgi:hypothetical protein
MILRRNIEHSSPKNSLPGTFFAGEFFGEERSDEESSIEEFSGNPSHVGIWGNDRVDRTSKNL